MAPCLFSTVCDVQEALNKLEKMKANIVEAREGGQLGCTGSQLTLFCL